MIGRPLSSPQRREGNGLVFDSGYMSQVLPIP